MGDAMAELDPLLDEDLNEADRRTVASLESDLPQSGNGPEPADLDEIAPPPPIAGPDIGAAPQPLPGAPETPPGMAPVPGSAEDIRARELTSEGISKQQADLDVQAAGIN